ncbi:SWIM zinc finger family protein [Streptomyces sp. NPDC001480]|uniref:SWIM zinc finger family protein n=1 Tax=Streptomyces sp. NPDC001480 TaxID=3364577 RepID=UPI0036A58475
MTGGEGRPADVARRALREALDARERGSGPPGSALPGSEDGAVAAEGEGGTVSETGPGAGDQGRRLGLGVQVAAARDEEPSPRGAAPEEKPSPEGAADRAGSAPGCDAPRPGDAARAALRSAVAARRGAGAAAEYGSGPAAPAAPVPAPAAPAEPASPPQDPAPDSVADRPAPQAAPTNRGPAEPGGRPGDIAREALRAARRATREAEPANAVGSPGRPAAPARAAAPQHVDRRKVAQDMREFLATAFRMPSMSGEPSGTADAGDPPPATVPGPPDRPPTAAAPPDTPAPPTTPPSKTAQPFPAAPLPTVPHTMATPHRDHDLRRTFPAYPPRPAQEARFAETWWGNAWVDALEQGALDVKRLARGRGYAEQGHVDAITVTPGLVLAYVRGSRPRPYRVQVRLRTLEEADWERFLDTAADRPGHIAALLDKELPHSLADCGVPLLPGPGDLAPRCSCPDSGYPCKHAAALCYQTARLLDADPFVLLLLRGRGERDLLDALSRRSAARAARADRERQPASPPGVRATDALAPRGLPPLPPPLPAPPHPQQPPVYPAAPGGPDPFALDQLATDAAARAHTLLTTGRDPVGELTLWQDAVRQAAARPGSGLTAGTRALYAALAAAAGRTPAELARAVAAWRQGGLEGLTVLEEPWDPPAGRFDRARPLLLAADLPAFRPWRNRLTHPRGHVQLRFGRDSLWYAYESEPDHDDWWPRGTPDPDPVGALTGLGVPGEA